MRCTLGIVAVFLSVSTAGAQERIGLGIAPHAGTLGVGVDVAYALHPRINVRAGANIIPVEPEFDISDISWKLDPPSPQFLAAVDLFLVSQLRVSGGLRWASDDLAAVGVFTGSVEVGGDTYDGADVGNLRGAIAISALAPWIGIGWGNVARSRIGFLFDLGLAFTGSPDVTLTADGPIASNATFQSSLNREIQEFEGDIDWVRYYPVVQVGVSFGF